MKDIPKVKDLVIYWLLNHKEVSRLDYHFKIVSSDVTVWFHKLNFQTISLEPETQETLFECKTVADQVNSVLGCEIRADDVYNLIVFNAKSFIRRHSETATNSSPTCRIEILDEIKLLVCQGQLKSTFSNTQYSNSQIQLYFLGPTSKHEGGEDAHTSSPHSQCSLNGTIHLLLTFSQS